MATKLESLSTKLQSALDLANSLPDAITLDELTNPGSAATMLEGTEMLDADGKKVTGTIESKTADDLSANGGVVTVPAGYYAEDATKSVGKSAPVIGGFSLDSSTGVVTYTGGVTEGYTSGVTIDEDYQLPTQPAKTITPTKSSQTAVAAGKYTTGAVTVGAIPDEYADVSKVSAYEDIVVRGYSFVDKNGNTSYGNLDISDAVQIRAYGGEVIENFTVSTSLGSPLDDNDTSHIAFDALLIGSVSPEHVLNGETFTSFRCDSLDGPITGGFKQTGTMPNNGSMSKTIDGLNTKSVSIPMGYTDGGTVALDSTIDDTADSQAAQIAEIKAMLEGKSVSGGGSAVETCTLTITSDFSSSSIGMYAFQAYENGEPVTRYGNSTTNYIEEMPFTTTVVCGSPFHFSFVNLDGSPSIRVSGVEYAGTGMAVAGKITAAAGETATLHIFPYG